MMWKASVKAICERAQGTGLTASAGCRTSWRSITSPCPAAATDPPARSRWTGVHSGARPRSCHHPEPGRARWHPPRQMKGRIPADKGGNVQRVVVVGAGFAGYQAAKQLCRRVPPGTEVVLINPDDYFLYLPLLPEVFA